MLRRNLNQGHPSWPSAARRDNPDANTAPKGLSGFQPYDPQREQHKDTPGFNITGGGGELRSREVVSNRPARASSPRSHAHGSESSTVSQSPDSSNASAQILVPIRAEVPTEAVTAGLGMLDGMATAADNTGLSDLAVIRCPASFRLIVATGTFPIKIAYD